MATTTVTINNSTWTEVLDGAGFAICPAGVYYSFHATAPTASFFVDGGDQVNGTAGQKLWAKSISANATVSVSPAS